VGAAAIARIGKNNKNDPAGQVFKPLYTYSFTKYRSANHGRHAHRAGHRISAVLRNTRAFAVGVKAANRGGLLKTITQIASWQIFAWCYPRYRMLPRLVPLHSDYDSLRWGW
jgi:hypothetical protein